MRTSPRPFTDPSPAGTPVTSRASAGLLGVLLAALLSTLLVGATLAPASAAPSAVARKVTARSGASSAPVRSAVLISGTLSRSPKGSAVKVQRLSGKKWVAVRSTRTTSGAGAFSTRVTLPGTSAVYSFRAVAPSQGRLKSAVSKPVKVSALTRVSVDMGALPSTVAAGSSTTFFGSVLPFVAGTAVVIQRQTGSTWSTVSSIRLNSTGGFSKGVAVTTAGTYRSVVPRVGLKASASSPSVAVRTTPVIATTALPNGLKGRTYSFRLTNIGNATGTWKASPLPAGLVVNGTTGVISGRPTATGDTAVKIEFTQAGTGYAAPSKTLAVHVSEPPRPVIETTSLPAVNLGDPYLATLKATGDPVGTWSAAPLPAGLVLDPATGVISGTPTTQGTTQVTVNFTETGNPDAALAKVVALTVNPAVAPVIKTTALAVGGVTQPYSATLEVTAVPAPPGTWSADPLPAGLTVDPATGVISGTPTAGGSTQVVVGFKQTSTGLTAAPKTLTLTVNALPVISTSALPNGATARAYSVQLAATGNPAGTWTAAPLPAGLVVDGSTGKITGTPTTPGTTQVVVGFTETATGLTATKTLALNVYDPPVVATATLPDGGVGKAYSTALAAVGGATGQWTAAPLPAGLSLNQGSGVISGTPTTSGTTTVTIGFTDASTGISAAPVQVPLFVAALPVISTTSLPSGHSGKAYSGQLSVAGNPAGTWKVTGAPGWLVLNPATGALSGTAPVVLLGSSYPMTFEFTQTSTGLKATKDLTITVTLL